MKLRSTCAGCVDVPPITIVVDKRGRELHLCRQCAIKVRSGKTASAKGALTPGPIPMATTVNWAGHRWVRPAMGK